MHIFCVLYYYSTIEINRRDECENKISLDEITKSVSTVSNVKFWVLSFFEDLRKATRNNRLSILTSSHPKTRSNFFLVQTRSTAVRRSRKETTEGSERPPFRLMKSRANRPSTIDGAAIRTRGANLRVRYAVPRQFASDTRWPASDGNWICRGRFLAVREKEQRSKRPGKYDRGKRGGGEEPNARRRETPQRRRYTTATTGVV